MSWRPVRLPWSGVHVHASHTRVKGPNPTALGAMARATVLCAECKMLVACLSPVGCTRCQALVCGTCSAASHVACSKCGVVLCRACRSDGDDDGCEADSANMMRSGCCGRVFCGDCVASSLAPTVKLACRDCNGVLRGSAIYTFCEYEVRVRAELRERWALSRSIESAGDASMRELQSLLEEQLEGVLRCLVTTVTRERLAARRVVAPLLGPAPASWAASRLLP